MNPKKAVNLYKTISEELEVDQNLVEDLMEYVYKTLRKDEHYRMEMTTFIKVKLSYSPFQKTLPTKNSDDI